MNAKMKTAASVSGWETQDFLTVTIAGQLFGIPVLQVQDVLGATNVTPVPLADKEIAGVMNLRGRIVTVIDVTTKLNLERKVKSMMSVVVEHDGELFSLMIDKVGDVLSLNNKDYEHNPATLNETWRNISDGIYRLDGSLLVVLDVQKLLTKHSAS